MASNRTFPGIGVPSQIASHDFSSTLLETIPEMIPETLLEIVLETLSETVRHSIPGCAAFVCCSLIPVVCSLVSLWLFLLGP